MQQAVGRQHGREGDPRQIHALGEHLRTDQDIGLAAGKPFQELPVTVPSAGGVPVEAQQAQVLQFVREVLEHLLGASAEGFEGRRAALSAAAFDFGAMVAPMAAEPGALPLAVDGEGDIAVGALHHLTAAAATQKAAVTPAWHQNDGLLAPFFEGLQAIHQGPTDQSAMPLRQLLPHVHHQDRGQHTRANPLG